MWVLFYLFFKRMMARTIPRDTKRGRPKKGQKTHSLKGTYWWGVDRDDLFWFFTNHHSQRIVVLIISKILKNQQSGESTQKLGPNNTSLNQCYMGIRICYRYLLIITWVYTHTGEKGSIIRFWCRTLVLNFFEIKK